jgi:hypothetical protein
MSGMRKQQREQADQEPLRPALKFAEGRLRYRKRIRNRRYRLAGALLILGVVTGVLVALLAGWLNTLAK